MKQILELIILIAVIASVGALTGCDPGGEPTPPPAELTDDERAKLEGQVERERQLRANAETRAEEADSARSFWNGVSFLLFVAALVTFVAGTAIGSKARHHAES